MTADPVPFDPAAGDRPCPVGSYLAGPLTGARQVVRWDDQFRDHHELADHVDPDAEASLSRYYYPPAPYCTHFKAAGYSPREYSGPSGCRFLVFDIDRAQDLDAALRDARTLLRLLLDRYGAKLDDGIGTY